jgi:RNA polymerase-binding transcription factor DksA
MDAKHARARLLELRTRLAARLQRIDRHLHHRDEPLPADSEERAGELGNRETLESLDGETAVELQQVDHALARLDAGLFGACESCLQPIGKDRLQLLPFATRCVRCAAQR